MIKRQKTKMIKRQKTEYTFDKRLDNEELMSFIGSLISPEHPDTLDSLRMYEDLERHLVIEICQTWSIK